MPSVMISEACFAYEYGLDPATSLTFAAVDRLSRLALQACENRPTRHEAANLCSTGADLGLAGCWLERKALNRKLCRDAMLNARVL